MRVAEHTITVDHVPVFFRTASADPAAGAAASPDPAAGAATAPDPAAGAAASPDPRAGATGPAASAGDGRPPILYLHGAPTSSDDWIPFLERTGGIAPDLIGFGRSGKGGHLDYSPEGLERFVERFLDELEVDRVELAGHDWGAAIGLLFAERHPARVGRVVLIDPVPLIEGFRWHALARVWRLPVLGELAMGSVTRSLLARGLRRGSSRPEAWTEAKLAAVWEQFDQGTQRALLRLHRAADESRLAELGESLAGVEAQTLIVWGDHDPWFAPELADRYAAHLPHATVTRVSGAGHWPWLDDPGVIDLVAGFLQSQ